MSRPNKKNTMLINHVEFYCKRQSDLFIRIKEIADNSKEFILSEFTTNKLPNYSDFKFKKVLYYFEVDEDLEICKTICSNIDERKKINNKDLKLPKVNMQNAVGGSKILYVGKSLGWFSTRLKQHFCEESAQTYALHFKHWKNIIGKEINLKMHYISFDNELKDNEDEILELLETSLHINLNPILGRTGH